MKNVDYIRAVPRIRAVENKLLDKGKIERLIDSDSKFEALKILNETNYGTLPVDISIPEDYEKLLKEELKRLFEFMYEITPDRKIVDIMTIKYDYHNIKVLLKGKILNKNLDYMLIPVGTVRINDLKKYISLSDYKELEDIMKNGIEKAIENFKEHKDPQKIDIILDDFMYKDMINRAKNLNESYILDFLQKNIDLINLKTLLRIRKQNKSRRFLEDVLIHGGNINLYKFLDNLTGTLENIIAIFNYTDYERVVRGGIEAYIESNNLNTLERLTDNFIIEFIKDSKYVSFGVEPLVAYIVAKENEIKIVRIIMVGKLNNISSDVIRERLREIYV